jgi:hypothetical protein
MCKSKGMLENVEVLKGAQLEALLEKEQTGRSDNGRRYRLWLQGVSS